MTLLQERLIREQTEEHDETYYLWALSFFMAFNRGNDFHTDLVSETMSIRTFHFIECNITKYYEMILTDRKEATSWSRRQGHSDVYSKLIKNEMYAFSPKCLWFILSRMHLALKAYQELLLNLNEMDHSQDENIRQSANIIKSKTLTVHVVQQLNLKLVVDVELCV